MAFKWISNAFQVRKVTHAFRVGHVGLLKVLAVRVIAMDEEAVVFLRTGQPEVHQLIGVHRDPGGIADDVHSSFGNLRKEFKEREVV